MERFEEEVDLSSYCVRERGENSEEMGHRGGVQSISALLPLVLAKYMPPVVALPLSSAIAVQNIANPAMTA